MLNKKEISHVKDVLQDEYYVSLGYITELESRLNHPEEFEDDAIKAYEKDKAIWEHYSYALFEAIIKLNNLTSAMP